MITFIVQCLLNEFLKTLHILFVNNLSENSESVGSYNIIVTLQDVFAQTGDNNEYLVLCDLEFLNENVNQSSEILMHRGRHLEEFSDIEEHR